MKQIFFILLLFILAAVVYSQDNLESIAKSDFKKFQYYKKLQKVQYPGDEAIDVTYYKLELNITSVPKYLSGATIIGIKPKGSGINTFFLDLQSRMNVDSVVLNNQQLGFLHSDDRLHITLPKVYDQGEQFYVKVCYAGIPNESEFGHYIETTHNGQRIISTVSEPYGAKDWFVCKDSPGDKADSSEVWITCPSGMIPVSNGTLESDIDNGNGTHTVKWKNHYPIAHYLISISLTNYIVYTHYFKYTPTDSMIVTDYVFPEDFNAQLRSELDRQLLMLKVFSERFGLYPFIKEKYGQAKFVGGGGIENQTISSLVSQVSEGMTVHEVAHQWFGNKITCADWNNIWINEGFAEYATYIFNEDTYGKDRYNLNIKYGMSIAKEAKGSVYIQDISSEEKIFDWKLTYKKGSIILHMLRGIVGDSIFFEILRTYLSDPELAYKTAVISDFAAIAEKVYGQSLKYFFDEWIYGENYPGYGFTWSSKSAGDNNYQVSINLSQVVNTNPVFFTMPVQFKITAGGRDTIVTVFNDQQNQSFTINVKGIPAAVVFDPHNFILKDMITTEVVNYDPVITPYKLDQNYPNPFNPSTVISFSLPEANTVTISVYNSIGELVEVLVNEQLYEAGDHEVIYNGISSSGGVYIVDFRTRNFRKQNKMVLVK